MRGLLRIVAWIILVGGPLAAMTRFVLHYGQKMTAGPVAGGWVGLTFATLLQGLLEGLPAIAIGGGLLLILDIDRRMQSSVRESA